MNAGRCELAGKLQDGAVDLIRKFNDRFASLKSSPENNWGGSGSEGTLSGRQDFGEYPLWSGQIEQGKENPEQTRSQKLIEVACHAQVVVHGGNSAPRSNGTSV